MAEKPFIDSHFHLLESQKKGLEPVETLRRAVEAGVCGGMDIGIDLDDIDLRLSALDAMSDPAIHPGFGYTLGLYPSFAGKEDFEADLLRLEAELDRRSKDPRLWAIGEIGMDFHWNYGSPGRQRELFQRQVKLAWAQGLPVVIHNREADAELYDALKQCLPTETPAAPPGVMHCFSSGVQAMEQFLELGFYISFGGNITFKNAGNIRDAGLAVPLDRVLLETDSPYLSPVPRRGKVNEPAHVALLYQFFAELRGTAPDVLKKQVYENFIRAVPRCCHPEKAPGATPCDKAESG